MAEGHGMKDSHSAPSPTGIPPKIGELPSTPPPPPRPKGEAWFYPLTDGEMASPPPPRPNDVRPFVLDKTLPTEKAPICKPAWRPSDPGLAAIATVIRSGWPTISECRQSLRTTSGRLAIRIVLFSAALLWWLAGIDKENAGWHYLGLGAAVWMACHWTLRWWTGRKLYPSWFSIPAAAAIAAMILFARFDAYTKVLTYVTEPSTGDTFELEGWHSGDPDLVNLERAVYLESRKRWDVSIYWCRIYYYAPGSRSEHYHGEGPMTATNKPHGHWTGYSRLSYDSRLPYESFDEWYWYGEKISEGEWELRNRR